MTKLAAILASVSVAFAAGVVFAPSAIADHPVVHLVKPYASSLL